MSIIRSYETMFIIAPTLGPEQYDRLVKNFEGIIADNGGTLTNTNKWGMRTLAYEVKKFKEGIYTIFEFEAPGDMIAELERRMRLNDSVLKYLTTRTTRKDKLVNKGNVRRKKAEARKKRKTTPSRPNIEGREKR